MTTKRTMTALTKAIKVTLLFQGLLLLSWLLSFELFINIEVSFFSAFFVMLGSMYSYAKLVKKQVEGYEGSNERDAVEKIDDPFDLYGELEPESAVDPETVDLKAVIREEKKRIKATGAAKNMKKTAPAMISLYRIIPYGLLVVGFIGLKNNGLLALWPYLAGLGLGVLGGFFVGKSLLGRAAA